MKAGWTTKRLEELVEIRLGRTPPRAEKKFWDPTKATDNTWVSIADLSENEGGVITESKEHLSKAGADSTPLVKAGTLLVSFKLSLGKVAIAGKNLRTNEAIAAMPIKGSGLDVNWLKYFFQFFDWDKAAVGEEKVKGKALNKEKLKEIEIPLPPVAEQKRIVALLDEAFVGIDTLSSNAKTRSSEALYVFEQERDSFFSNPDNKYTETTISDITTRLQYGTSEKSASTGRYVVLRMGNIQDGEIDYEDLKYTSSQEVIDQYSLKPGDVLFNRTNSPQWVGKSAIYRGEMPAVFAGYNIKIHTIADKVDSEFLTFFLNSDRAMSFGRATFISSVNQANINAEKLRSYRLPLPPLREQKAIADRLGQIRKMSRELAAIYQNSLAQSHHLKAATLRSAFNGTL